MKKLWTLLSLFLVIIAAFFFNVWYIQQIYEVGIIPVVSLFNVELPLISYNAFIVIVFLISSIKAGFGYTNETKDKVKLTYGTDEFNDGLTKFFGQVLGVILTKLFNLLILALLIKYFI